MDRSRDEVAELFVLATRRRIAGFFGRTTCFSGGRSFRDLLQCEHRVTLCVRPPVGIKSNRHARESTAFARKIVRHVQLRLVFGVDKEASRRELCVYSHCTIAHNERSRVDASL